MMDDCGLPRLAAALGLWTACGLVAAGCGEPPRAPEAPKRSLGVTGAGAALERLTTEPTTERQPQISPDGKVLLFQVAVFASDTSDIIRQQVLNAVDPNTRANRSVYTSTNCFSNGPAWLPDQSSYVYASNAPGDWSLVRALSAAPNAAVSVVAAHDIAPGASVPEVSPDGTRVAFSVEARGARNIGIIGIDGSRFTLLGEGNMPSWSPDGATLAFVRTVNGYNQLFLVNAVDGTGLVQLTTGETHNDFPSWSPDGQYIVYSTNRGWNRYPYATEKGVFNLYLLKRDGTGVTQLTEGDSIATDPDWGKDGWIYFASNQGGSFDIWRMQVAGVQVGPPLARPTAPPALAPSATPPPATAPGPAVVPPPPASGDGCAKDIDCKGNRVCERGVCVAPK
jgi:TolB protein